MASQIPRSAHFMRHPQPLDSPLGPPTPTLAAQLSYMLQQPSSALSASPLFSQERHVRFQSRLQQSHLVQLQTPRSTPRSTPQPPSPPSPPIPRSVPQQLPTPRTLLPPQTPRSVRFSPPQQQIPHSVPDPDPPRNLLETAHRCTRCKNVLCIPPSTTFITSTLPPSIRPVHMDRTRPRCVACDLTRTKEMCKDLIAPAPNYVDPIQKIQSDMARMEAFIREGVKVEEMRISLVEVRRRLDREGTRRAEGLKSIWERFYGAWGPGAKAGSGRKA